ncbi:Gluconate transporter family protein [Caballeronia sordidicola]|uniref:Gluconate transporter family protein n=1 Tax=Caballeronia sordidicola TaxID=196367 RepID=A0A242N881_CABSO|nr:Gluconate transporter family protein [Caballeronia sordidicola]
MHLTSTFAAWSDHDTRLLIACALGLASIIVLISALKLAPFLSILVGTFVAGFTAGLPLEAVASAFSKGAGGLLGDVGIIIARRDARCINGGVRRCRQAGLDHSRSLHATVLALVDGAGGNRDRLAALF